MDAKVLINKICYQIEDQEEAFPLVDSLGSSAELYELLDHYNWDDGYGIPTRVANHKCCDLAIAQRLYWLAEADYWYEKGKEVNEHNREHFEFSTLISKNIESGHYQIGTISHSENFDRVQVFKFKKRGFPEVFYMPVMGRHT